MKSPLSSPPSRQAYKQYNLAYTTIFYPVSHVLVSQVKYLHWQLTKRDKQSDQQAISDQEETKKKLLDEHTFFEISLWNTELTGIATDKASQLAKLIMECKTMKSMEKKHPTPTLLE